MIYPHNFEQKIGFDKIRQHIENKCLPCNSVILLEHIRTVDKSRLEEYQGKLTQEEISELDKALAISLDLKIREDKKNG